MGFSKSERGAQGASATVALSSIAWGIVSIIFRKKSSFKCHC